jgi:hypothetical protein
MPVIFYPGPSLTLDKQLDGALASRTCDSIGIGPQALGV